MLSLSFFNLNAQFKCGNEEPASIALPPEYTDDIGPCFDIQLVKDECITIYLNVNVHYFLDDNCEGGIKPKVNTKPLTPEDFMPAHQGHAKAEETVSSFVVSPY